MRVIPLFAGTASTITKSDERDVTFDSLKGAALFPDGLEISRTGAKIFRLHTTNNSQLHISHLR